MGSEFHNLRTVQVHYVYNNNAFSLSSTTVKVQKKVLLNAIHFYYVASHTSIVLPKGP